MLFLETPSNPDAVASSTSQAVAKIADKHGALLVVDNAFASPALQRPMEFGAHIVVHSSTKYIDGQGRALGGVILCDQEFLDEHLQVFLRNTGPTHQPLQCLAASEEPGDAGPAHEAALRECASGWPTSWPARRR